MTMFIAFFIGAVIGVIIGFLAAVAGQLSLEKGFKLQGVAKIDGEYYKITKINNFYEGDDK